MKTIQEVVQNIGRSVDRNRWSELAQSFAPQVEVDYSSMTGEAPKSLTPEEIVEMWKPFLENFDEVHHYVTGITVVEEDTLATVESDVFATHHIVGFESWKVYGRYSHFLKKIEGEWKVYKMIFHFSHSEGSQDAVSAAVLRMSVGFKRVILEVGGERVVGNLYSPKGCVGKLSAFVIGGSWTTVKEQMMANYAQELAKAGYVALTLDPRGFGESAGLKGYESATRKIEEYTAGFEYLSNLECVDWQSISLLGLCASSGYMLKTAQMLQSKVKTVFLAAPWLHNCELVEMIYGGKEGVSEKIQMAEEAFALYQKTGVWQTVPACSTTNPYAAMFGEFEYYLDSNRGAVKAWDNTFAVASWKEWLEFDAFSGAEDISAKIVVVHSKEGAIPMGVDILEKKAKKCEVLWTTGSQFDFYDNTKNISEVITIIKERV